MKGCSKFREQLSAFIDEKLGADETRQLEEHLKSCAQCSGALDELKKTIAHLNSLEQVDAPTWLTQRVMARINVEGDKTEKGGFLAKLFRPLHVKMPLGALATVVLAVTTYFFFQGVIPEMQHKQPEQYSRAPAKAPGTEKAPEQAVAPQKKLKAKEHAESGRVVGKLEQSELPRQKAEVAAPAQREMRAGAMKEEQALAPAAPSERQGLKMKPSREAKKDAFELGKGGIARDESKSRLAPAPSATNAGPAMAEKSPVLFHVSAEDAMDAGRQIENALTGLGGKGIKIDSVENKTIVKAEIDAAQLPEFLEALKRIGSVQEKTAPAPADVNSVVVTIEILPAAQQPTKP